MILVLKVSLNDPVHIEGVGTVELVETGDGWARLGFAIPETIRIYRDKVYQQIKESQDVSNKFE